MDKKLCIASESSDEGYPYPTAFDRATEVRRATADTLERKGTAMLAVIVYLIVCIIVILTE